MKNLSLAVIYVGLSLFSHLVFADIPIQSNADVQGNWKLEYAKKSVTSEDIMKREDSWAFNNGKVTITHIPREGVFYDQTPVDYVIEGGKLKISILGRPDKFDIFSLLEKDDKSMTLKGKFGDVYHFIKK
ncbi:MAG: hypothetical protein ABSB19_14865 [Methylomonas sp.]|jgi:hypothetical protein